MTGRQGHNAVSGQQGFQRVTGTEAEIELTAPTPEPVHYDFLRPPYPVSATAVYDYWSNVDIPDDEVRKMARYIHPWHPSYAEGCVRATGALRDADEMGKSDTGAAEARVLREMPSLVPRFGHVSLIEMVRTFKLLPVIEKGIDAMSPDRVVAHVYGKVDAVVTNPADIARYVEPGQTVVTPIVY